ncbi:tRNA N6-adenosine threonylcarbamoyltransferase, mitochondrial isoform X7 [Anomaloglossus baeobatrachus]|uniref:tRNA N6-adenosine threonylcarbamoyltransferase, mitochondrial isoform X7 n=1 Tax=Anomaloglossus baeobatrachus TaxID=238106 RepID=UPI003F4FFE07
MPQGRLHNPIPRTKVARRLSLFKLAECSSMSGGQSIEYLAQFGEKTFINHKPPMTHYQDCNFSFTGLRNHYNCLIKNLEDKEGMVLRGCALVLESLKIQKTYVMNQGQKMKAIILAAGYGTRLLKDLQSVNEQKLQDLIGIPKPLLPVRGFPLISYWIEALKAGQDPKDVFIVTNEMYYGKFKEWAKNYPSVAVISDGTSTNEERLGAVSCLQLIIETFKIEDSIMVIGGDTLFYEDFHLQDVLKNYDVLYQGNNEANLVLSYICKDEETKKYGIMETDESQRIQAIKEKPLPTDTSSRQACPCFYLFSKYTLPCVKEFLDEKKDAPIDEKDAPGHFLSWLVTRKPVYFYSISGRFDVGNLASYLLCNKYFQEKISKLNYLQ